MGMSTNVIGFRPPDEKWKKMKAVWDACLAADTDIPEDVNTFFNGDPPDERGVEVELTGPCCAEWSDDYRQGYEIDVTKLPEGLAIIRFYNSW